MVRVHLPGYFVGKSLPVVAVLEEGNAGASAGGGPAYGEGNEAYTSCFFKL